MDLLLVCGSDQFSTLIALVSSCILIVAEWADAFHETVSKVTVTLLAQQLIHRVLQEIVVAMETVEDVLCYPGNMIKIKKVH